MKHRRDLIEEIMTPTSRLIVRQPDAGHVVFVDADGHSRTFETSGKKERHQLTNGTVDTKSSWEDGKLVMSFAVDRGPTIVESWSLDSEHHRLQLATEFDRGGDRRGPATTVVYDASPEP